MFPVRCALCQLGELRPARLTMTITYDGKTYVFPNLDAKVCQECGEEYLAEKGASILLMYRNLAPNSNMSATFIREDKTHD
jgi:YgiT-type zinc finger domain-containing protein